MRALREAYLSPSCTDVKQSFSKHVDSAPGLTVEKLGVDQTVCDRDQARCARRYG